MPRTSTTLLCVPILVEDPDQASREAVAARDAGADLVEFRVDAYFTGNEGPDSADELEAIQGLVDACPLPCIVTCRPVLEGGHYRGTDAARIALFERLGTAAASGRRPPAYIDVELATYWRSENLKQKVNLAVQHPGQVRPVETTLILSTHDFNSRPPDLLRQIEAMLREPACGVIKVAYRARSLRDNLELLELLAELRDRIDAGHSARWGIALGMGPFGLMSRVLAPKFGGFLTFAALRRDSATAPGQPIISELLDRYRFRSISSSTRVLGVVGYPVEHSLSPLVHNAGFQAVGHDAVYLPMPIPPEYEHFKATMLALIEHPHLDFAGCSVTIPHKPHLVRLAAEMRDQGDGAGVPRWTIDELSARCGAANTLHVQRDPKGRPVALSISNTDGPGLVAVLRARLGEVRGRIVAILGAGGTARAAAAALALAGARVRVLNRTHEHAVELCRAIDPDASLDLRAVGNDWIERGFDATPPEAVVNCTPLGMDAPEQRGQSPLTPQQVGALPAGCTVMDCVYVPLRTPLLSLAVARGLPVIDGATLFVAQAAEQFSLWTGQRAPAQLFDRIVRETLAG
jgi:3-dehydroquinate dehydratase/shikimate dehydrogenase